MTADLALDIVSDETPSAQIQGSPPKKERGPDECFEFLVAMTGATLQTVTKGMRGEINTALRDIRTVMPEVTAKDMQRRADAYRQKWPNVTCSPSALAKHWGSLQTGAKKEGGVPPAVENLCPVEFEAACLDLYGRVPGPWALLGIAEQADIRAWCEKERGAGE